MKGKLFYEGEEVVAINNVTKPVDEHASRASNLVYNNTYIIEMYWRFCEGHWWLSVKEIGDAVYTEDEFASLCSTKELESQMGIRAGYSITEQQDSTHRGVSHSIKSL